MRHKFGWIGPEAEKRAFDAYRTACDKSGTRPMILDYAEASDSIVKRIERMKAICGGKPRPKTWDLSRQLHAQGLLNHAILPTWFQLIGDCVAVSTADVLTNLSLIEVALECQQEKVWTPHPSWIYAVGRHLIAESKIPADRSGNADGMLGSWSAQAVQKYGVLFTEKNGVPAYSEATCKWGDYKNNFGNKNAEYLTKYGELAKPHTVTAIRCRTFEDGQKIFDAGGVLTIASSWSFAVKTVGGRHQYVRTREGWGHQMSFSDYENGNGFTGWYRMNQWGPDHATPLNGERPGGAWQDANLIAQELKGDHYELFGYLDLKGEEAEPNWEAV